MDMIYGILKSNSLRISNIAEALMEDIDKVNSVQQLCKNLKRGVSSTIEEEYIKFTVSSLIGKNPITLVDDTDAIKKYGNKFDSLGRIVDGSSETKKTEGYQVTEVVAITENENHPISLHLHIHSSAEV